METIKGTVIKALFENEENGYKVLKIKTPTSRPVITGEFGPEVVKGSEIDFHGDYKTHPKYGHQFKVSSYTITHDVAKITSIRLFIDSIAPNFGSERSELVVQHFGQDTIDILDKTPERLSEINGIGEKLAGFLTDAWKNNRDKWKEVREEFSLRAFLNSVGMKEKRVKKILSHFGGGFDAEDRIRENPYILCEVKGFGFTTADHIARQLGISEGSPERLKSFVVYALEVLCPSNGHLYLLSNEIYRLILRYSTENATSFLDGKVGMDDIEDITKQLLSANRVKTRGEAIYSTQCYDFETKSAQVLSNVMEAPSDLIFINDGEVEKHIKVFERENGLTLSKEQRDAVHCFIEHKVFVITGGPGTGKTTLLKAIVDLIKRMKLRLTCMTPTGISAKKLAITIDHEAYTIHRRLGFRGSVWTHCEANPYDTDVAIIDEASMIDQEVFFRLLSAMKKRVHMIFVGDHNQLPSVGAGNVLKELIGCGDVPVIKLEKIFRQSEASDIIRVAHRIKNGDSDLSLFSPDPKSDVFFMRENNPARIEEIVIALSQKFKDEKRQFQIITARNDGPCSVDSLNTALQGVLNPPSFDLNEIKCYSYILRRGDRIIVKKNDYENSIFNGDIGKVVSIAGGFVNIEVDKRLVQLTVDELEEKIRLGYAISIHKSQGLEYPFIIMPFINQFGLRLLQRNLLYTAITRAKEKVIVIGHGSALEKAIKNASVTKRNTFLGEHIKECLQKKKCTSKDLPEKLPGKPKPCPTVKTPLEQFSSELDKLFHSVLTEDL